MGDALVSHQPTNKIFFRAGEGDTHEIPNKYVTFSLQLFTMVSFIFQHKITNLNLNLEIFLLRPSNRLASK